MRWKAKDKRKLNKDGTEVGLLPKDKPKWPQIGDTKSKTKFTWTPKKIDNYWYWLEYCKEVYEWKEYTFKRQVPYNSMTDYCGSHTRFLMAPENEIIKTIGWKLIEIKPNQR